jgi:hypothetical protein
MSFLAKVNATAEKTVFREIGFPADSIDIREFNQPVPTINQIS